MDRVSLQFELCKYAATVLRDNCNMKTEPDDVLDMALDVLLKTFEALGRGFDGEEKQNYCNTAGPENV